MAPKLVGRLLVLNLGQRLCQWRVTSSSGGRAFLVNMTTGQRGMEQLHDLYDWIDQGIVIVKES
jgi:hypothetical protein